MLARRLALVAVVAALLAAMPAGGPAGTSRSGATITVNTTDDGVDARPGDGACSTSSRGVCTLRAAVMETNALPGADTIVLPAGAYRLLRVPDPSTGAADGDLYVADGQTLDLYGPAGATATSVEQTVNDRALHVGIASVVRISGIRLWHGHANTRGPLSGRLGGTLAVDRLGQLTLSYAIVELSGARLGGGIYVEVNGQLTLERTIVRDNVAEESGGGIYSNHGILTIRSSTIADNEARAGNGGGIRHYAFAGPGALTVERSLFLENTAFRDLASAGGAVDTVGSTSDISDSLFRANWGMQGGALHAIDGETRVERGTFASNHAGVNGGGIFAQGLLRLRNSTLTLNFSGERGGGIYHNGVGRAPRALVEIHHSTITGNLASIGGGIFAGPPSDFITVSGTILDGEPAGAYAPSCNPGLAFAHSDGGNIDRGSSCTFLGPSDATRTDPRLASLRSNGGPTPTQALLDGSPALDFVSSGCPPPAADQRSARRPAGPRCDSGAYERGASPPESTPAGAAVSLADLLEGVLSLSFSVPTTRSLRSDCFELRPLTPWRRLGQGAFTVPLGAGSARERLRILEQGGLVFSRGEKSVRVESLALEFDGRSGTVLARIGSSRGWVPFLSLSAARVAKANGRLAASLPATLTAQAAHELARGLGRGCLRTGSPFGTFRIRATYAARDNLAAPPPLPPPTPAPTTPTQTTTPAPAQLPDLVIDSLSTFSFTVVNVGKGPAGDFVVKVTGVGDFKILGLSPGEKAQKTWKTCKPGPITATADSTGLIKETDEKNNTRSFTILKC